MSEYSLHPPKRKKRPLIPLHNIMGPDSEITEEQYENCKASIEAVRKGQALCENCNGKECAQIGHTGYVLIFKCFGGSYEESMYPCPLQELIQQKNRIRELREQSGIPQVYAHFKFADLPKMEMLEANRQIATLFWDLSQNPKNNQSIFLYGTSGVGKTLLASILGNALLKTGKEVLFCTISDFLNQLRSHIKRDWNSLLACYQNVPCLILDDVGNARITEWGLEQVYRLLDARHKDGRQTIFTSRYSLVELRKKWLISGRFEDPEGEDPMEHVIDRIAAMTNQYQLTEKVERWELPPEILKPKSLERKKNDEKQLEIQEQDIFA